MSASAPRLAGPFRANLHVEPGHTDAFEQWRVGVAPMFAMDAADPMDRPEFRLRGVSFQFADMAVASVTSSATVFDRNARVIGRSGIDHILVQAYLTGGYRLAAEGREIEVKSGDICVLDLTRPCLLRGTSFTHLSMLLPRAELDALVPDLDALHGLILPSGTPLNGLLLSHMRTLYAEAPNLGTSEGVAAGRATVGLIAACLAPSASGREAASLAAAASLMGRLRRLIEANLGDPSLGPEYLCRRGGVSRATLYRLFEPLGGVSVYIRQRRLTRAFRMLSDTALRSRRISEVAARCGFSGNAVFSRALRLGYGMSPTEIRANAGGRSHALAGDGVSPFEDVNRWLLGANAAAD